MPAVPVASVVTTLRDLGLPGAIGVTLGWLLTRHTTARTLVVQQKRAAAALLLDALVDARLAVSPLAPLDELLLLREALCLASRSGHRYGAVRREQNAACGVESRE